jgi:hypothetical protein
VTNSCGTTTVSKSLTINGVPGAPGVSVVNNCNGTSTLTALGLSTEPGTTILWNTGASTNPITVSGAGTYSVTQNVGGCTSPAGYGTVVVRIAPVINCPANITVSSERSSCGANVRFSATASGTPTPAVTYSISSGAISSPYTFPVGATLVTATAINNCGSSSCTFTVTVNDNTAPHVNCPVNNKTNRNTNSGCTYIVAGNEFNATATDNCAVTSLTYTLTGATTRSGSSLAGIAFNKGTTTVTWTAKDAAGNTDVCSFDVKVEDKQNPVVTCPVSNNNTTRNANAGVCTYKVVGTEFNATASDNCSSTTIKYALTGTTSGTGTSLANVVLNGGVTHVTWTATDASGNTASCIFDVTVKDIQAPVISCKANATKNTNTGCAYKVSGTEFNPTATDNCGTPTLTYSLSGATSGSGSSLAGVAFNKGTTTVTWTAKDAANNTTTCSFDVTVADNQAPAITCPGNISTCKTANGQYTIPLPIISDNCGIASVSYEIKGATKRGSTGNDASGAFSIGTSTITWTVTDASGNKSTCTTTVVISNTACTVREYVTDQNTGSGKEQNNTTTTAPTNNNGKVQLLSPESFKVVVYPNPSATDFRIQVQSNSDELINIRVVDALGRVIATITGVQKTSLVTLGGNYRGGSYFAEVVQGANHKTVKLIKL